MQEARTRLYNENEVGQIIVTEARRQRIGVILTLLHEKYAGNPETPAVITGTIRMVLEDYGFINNEQQQPEPDLVEVEEQKHEQPHRTTSRGRGDRDEVTIQPR
jgi:hypothetical protein